jgi:hypothetical protein
MRRLLAAVVTACLVAGLAVPALALADKRLPSGITRVYLTISFPLQTVSGSHKPVHKTLTKAASVAEAVDATDALPVAKVRGMCPMIMRVGPELTVVFKNAHGTQVAAAEVQVTQGSKGDSGSSACFPIRFTSSGRISDLLGNSWVRTMGKLAGTSIS